MTDLKVDRTATGGPLTRPTEQTEAVVAVSTRHSMIDDVGCTSRVNPFNWASDGP